VNQFCTIVNKGQIFPEIHQSINPKPNNTQVDQWIVDYFNKHKKESLKLDNGAVCDIVGKYVHHEIMVYVVKDINSDRLVSIGKNGIIIFNDKNKKTFFDTLFKENNKN